MDILMVTHHRRFKANWRTVGLARQLVRRGHAVTIVCTANTERWRFRATSEDGIEIFEAPDLLVGSLRSGWDPYDTLRRMRFLQSRSFDLIHAFETRPATIYPVLAQARRRPVPVVIDWIDWWGRGGLISEHRPVWYQRLFGGMETYYEEHFRTRAHATTVIARGLAERAAGLGVDPAGIFWIPNGCDPDRFEPVPSATHRAEFGVPLDRFVVGFSALDVTLGVRRVVAAMEELVRERPDAMLLMTGKRDAALDDLLSASTLGDRVLHLGIVPDEKYLAALSCCDAFALPFVDRIANHGRWPGRINDYLLVGRPIVTNPVGEMRRLFDAHDIGILAPESPERLAEAIRRLVDDPSAREEMGKNARYLAEGELNWTAVMDRVEDAYRHATTAHGSAA